jgi:two-component system sensor histidine kinase/response regulator
MPEQAGPDLDRGPNWTGRRGEPAGAMGAGSLQGIRVLLAEDDPVNRLLARDLLEGWGIEVAEADNGREAVVRAAQGGFDLILMDIQMPEMDGYEASRRIGALPGGKDLPIIAVTAHAMADERQKCLAAGMKDCITKPVEAETLYSALCRWLALSPDDFHKQDGAPPIQEPGASTPDGLEELNRAGFDVAKVGRWLCTNPGVYQTMLQTWAAEYAGATSAIEAALDADETDVAVAALHRLRGAAGVLGASDLEVSARFVEDALRRDGRAAPELRRRFVAAGERVMASLAVLDISAAVEESGADARIGPQAGDCLDVAQRLDTLEEVLVAGNTRALDYLPWLRRCIGAELSEEYRLLVQQIEGLDFEDALLSLRRLA